MWESIKVNDKKEMDAHIVSFSDIVLQKSLEKISYVEFRTENDLKLFHFDKEEAYFIGLKSKTVNLEKFDLSKKDLLKEIDLFKSTKKYTISREKEVFDLLNKGCTVSDGALYYQLKKFIG